MKEIDKIQKPKGTVGFFNKLVASIAPSKYHACRVTYAFGWSTQIMSEFELKKVINVASLEIQIVQDTFSELCFPPLDMVENLFVH